MNKISEEEKKEKLIEYSNRGNFWTNQVMTQFGYSINFFLTIGIALIGFIVSKRDNFNKINFVATNFDWKLLFYFISLLLVLISIIFGSISVLSRLYDLRITRHILIVRKKAMKKIPSYLSEETIEVKNKFLNVFNFQIDYIVDNDYDIKNIELLQSKFKTLKTQSITLGNISWKSHKRQILFLMFSVVIFGVIMVIK
jgi:hypothetical protein